MPAFTSRVRPLVAGNWKMNGLGAQLAEARQKNDMQSVRHAVHTLKSSSASIGALRLSRLCAEIEAAVRQETLTGLPTLLDDVDREMAVVLQALQPMRETPSPS